MSGSKIAIVTGANSGIGLETARGLAKKGFEVILAVRDQAKGDAAAADIAGTEPGAKLHVIPLDLGSMASIRTFARTFDERFPALDVLVNNAALVPATRTLTVDGLETQFGVNHLGPFLLTNLLLPKLKAAPQGRIVVVSSTVHNGATIDFDDLQSERSYSSMRKYSSTKLMNLLFVHSLKKRLAGTKVTVNGLHPGVVSTALARDFNFLFRWIAKLFFTTPEKGARTSLHVATSPDLESTTGAYFDDSREKQPDPSARNDATAERLWDISAKLAGI